MRREFFLLLGIDLEVEGGFIEEIELTIPWKSLQTEVRSNFRKVLF